LWDVCQIEYLPLNEFSRSQHDRINAAAGIVDMNKIASRLPAAVNVQWLI
jgi:hypothetical protein